MQANDAVDTLLKHQSDVNARDKKWQTPFHVAAANNAVGCVSSIIPKLSNINITDRAGRFVHSCVKTKIFILKYFISGLACTMLLTQDTLRWLSF